MNKREIIQTVFPLLAIVIIVQIACPIPKLPTREDLEEKWEVEDYIAQNDKIIETYQVTVTKKENDPLYFASPVPGVLNRFYVYTSDGNKIQVSGQKYQNIRLGQNVTVQVWHLTPKYYCSPISENG